MPLDFLVSSENVRLRPLQESEKEEFLHKCSLNRFAGSRIYWDNMQNV